MGAAVSLTSLTRISPTRRTSLAATAAIALVGAVVLSYAPASAGAASPGTVKVDNADIDATGNDNSPHQACAITIQFFGYAALPAPHQAVVTFTAKPPSAPNGTAISTVPVSPPDPAAVPYTFVGGSGSGTTPDGQITYRLDTTGLQVDNKGGYHVDVNVQVDGSGKSKEFFVTACPSDLKIEKTASVTAPAAVQPGTSLSYTVTVTNTGPVTTTGFEVTDTLGAGLTMGSITSPAASWACSGTTVDCFYQLNLAPLATATLTYTATVSSSAGSSVKNAASVSPTDATPNDNSTDVTTNVVRPDLTIAKTGATSAVVGTPESYSLVASNVGTAGVTGTITVTDTLAAGETATAASGTGWTCGISTQTHAGDLVTCTRGDGLAAGATYPTITVSISFSGTSPTSNTARITIPANDPDTANNQSTVTTSVSAAPAAVLGIVKAGPTGAAQVKHPGDTFDYTLTVSNSGNLAATSFTVTDSLPVGLTTTATPAGSGFDCTASTATFVDCSWTGSLTSASPAATAQLTVPVRIAPTFSGASLSNTGSVDEINSNTVVTTVQDVAPTATVLKTSDANGDEQFNQDETTTTAGKTVPFRLHITNTSPYGVDVVSVTDAVDGAVTGTAVSCLPALTLGAGQSGDCGFAIESYSPADGLNKTNVATVELRKSAPSTQASLRLKALVAAGPTATVPSNVATVRTRVPAAQPVTPLTPLTPLIPASAAAPSATQSSCSNGAATTPSYTVPTTPGVVYTPAVGGPAAAGSTVTVTAAAAPGFVLTGPSSFTLSFAAAPDCTVPGEDLGLSKSGPGTATAGDVLTYTLDVTNVKGTPATGFTVTDTLPDGLSFVSADGTDVACTALAAVITCTYGGTLAVGESARITVRALLLATFEGTTVTNTAVVDPGRSDVDGSNNTSSVTTGVLLTGFTSGGGTAEIPTPAPGASPVPAPAATGDGLPFTGVDAGSWTQTGVGMLLIGMLLALAARRRPAGSAAGAASARKRGAHRRR